MDVDGDALETARENCEEMEVRGWRDPIGHPFRLLFWADISSLGCTILVSMCYCTFL